MAAVALEEGRQKLGGDWRFGGGYGGDRCGGDDRGGDLYIYSFINHIQLHIQLYIYIYI